MSNETKCLRDGCPDHDDFFDDNCGEQGMTNCSRVNMPVAEVLKLQVTIKEQASELARLKRISRNDKLDLELVCP